MKKFLLVALFAMTFVASSLSAWCGSCCRRSCDYGRVISSETELVYPE